MSRCNLKLSIMLSSPSFEIEDLSSCSIFEFLSLEEIQVSILFVVSFVIEPDILSSCSIYKV